MKTWLFIVLSCLCADLVSAQTEVPPYKKTKAIPAFELELADHSTFTQATIKKNVPLIIMFFSPGCEHCQHQTEAMIKRMNDLKKYQIVMATFQPVEEVAEFNKKYLLSKYPNITVGRDGKYALPPFFEIHNFPYLAFYNKSGQFLSAFEGNMDVDTILKRFK
ncbi:MAG: protein disulfide isomerase family protein [Flavitalea sp.]